MPRLTPRPKLSLPLATLCLGLIAPSITLACQLPANASALRAEVIALANLQRQAKRLPPVTEDAALARAAQTHACDNADSLNMSHKGSDGSNLTVRMKRVGYAYREASENVAAGFFDAPSVMSGWMGSKGHRRNILSRGAQDIGIGVAMGRDGQLYWTMNLGRD